MTKKDRLQQLLINRFAAPLFRLLFRVKGEKTQLPAGPNLIISNHVTNFDFLLIESRMNCRSPHMVVADNAVRGKIPVWGMNHMMNTIPTVKGAHSVATVKKILQALRSGNNVMLFPEGNTSFDGRTAPMAPSIGKLAKRSGANLMLVRISGGYFSRPRWATSLRRGRVSLTFTPVPAEALKTMSPEEITALINQALYVDAYSDQEKDPILYRSSAPCVGLERAIYRCPACGTIGNLMGRHNHLRCSCGYDAEMNSLGYLTDDLRTYSITQQLDDQKKALLNLLDPPTEAPLWRDRVEIVERNSREPARSTPLGTFTLTACHDRVLLDGEAGTSQKEIHYDDISGISIVKANTLTVFLHKDQGHQAYEIHGSFSFNALKYRDLYELTVQRKAEEMFKAGSV